MDWLPQGTFDRGVVGGLVVGMAWFVLVCLYRSVIHVGEFGFWSWMKSAFKIEHDSLGLILVLLTALLVTALVFRPWPLSSAGP